MVRWLVGIIVMDVAVACLILFGCCQVEVLAVFSHDRADSPPAGSVLGRLTAAVHAPMTYVAVFIFSLPPASLSLHLLRFFSSCWPSQSIDTWRKHGRCVRRWGICHDRRGLSPFILLVLISAGPVDQNYYFINNNKKGQVDSRLASSNNQNVYGTDRSTHEP